MNIAQQLTHTLDPNVQRWETLYFRIVLVSANVNRANDNIIINPSSFICRYCTVCCTNVHVHKSNAPPVSPTRRTNNTTFPFGTNENAFANRNYSLFRLKYLHWRPIQWLDFVQSHIHQVYSYCLWWIRVVRNKCGSGYCCDPWMWMEKTNREEFWNWSNMKQSNRLNCIRLNCRQVQFELWCVHALCSENIASIVPDHDVIREFLWKLYFYVIISSSMHYASLSNVLFFERKKENIIVVVEWSMCRTKSKSMWGKQNARD